VNDALLIGEMLRSAGFEVRQVHDDSATQAAILSRLETEIAGLRDGDYFVYWNSSHGYQLRDGSGDELFDFLDEAACTYDTDPRDPLTDDKFARILSRADPGATIFIGSDSCHSGTVTRMMHDEMTQEDERAYRQPRLWIPPDDIRFRSGPVIDLDGYVRRDLDLAAYVPSSSESDGTALNLRNAARAAVFENQAKGRGAYRDAAREAGRSAARERDEPRPREIEAPQPDPELGLRRFGQLAPPHPQAPSLGASARGEDAAEEQMNHLLLSGCLPMEVSYDASFSQGSHGAMTYHFAMAVLEAWQQNQNPITYEEAWQTAQQGLTEGAFGQRFDQTPQLEGPRELKESPVFGHIP
jgi:hypothetical protein